MKKTKQARLGQIILSGILPVCGNRIQGYMNSKSMAVNGMVERLCKEEDVAVPDLGLWRPLGNNIIEKTSTPWPNKFNDCKDM